MSRRDSHIYLEQMSEEAGYLLFIPINFREQTFQRIQHSKEQWCEVLG